jgi:hypothetical protein
MAEKQTDAQKQDALNQEQYDVDRTAISDDRDDQKKGKELPDAQRDVSSHKYDAKSEVSPTTLNILQNMGLQHQIIGNNEYLLLPVDDFIKVPKTRTFDFDTNKNVESDDILHEILALHGTHAYYLTGKYAVERGYPADYKIKCIAIPLDTLNMPSGVLNNDVPGIISTKSHTDVWKENLQLDTARTHVIQDGEAEECKDCQHESHQKRKVVHK